MIRPLSKIEKNSNGCWIWTGTKDRAGYGRVCVLGKTTMAHRVFYEEFVGAIPHGLFVLHRCDVPSCVNPAHLFCGTQLDNMRDMTAKGRGADRNGERNGTAKLTEEQVVSIRELARDLPSRRGRPKLGTPSKTVSSIAAAFGISRRAVRFIIQKKTWRHL